MAIVDPSGSIGILLEGYRDADLRLGFELAKRIYPLSMRRRMIFCTASKFFCCLTKDASSTIKIFAFIEAFNEAVVEVVCYEKSPPATVVVRARAPGLREEIRCIT